MLPTFIKREIVESQGSNLWLKTRKNMVTSTDISFSKSGGDFIKRKLSDSIVNNKATNHGTLLEPISKLIFNKIYNVQIQDCGLIKHKKYNIGASPDGYFYWPNTTIPMLIEIKNPYSRPITNLVPYNYWMQMQSQLFVTDLPICYYFETVIKFKKILTEQDKKNYEFYGKCNGDLKDLGNFWYLENYFETKCERDDIWIQNNLKYFENLCYKLKKNKSRKRNFTEMLSTDIKPLFYYNENSMHNYFNNDTLSDWLDMYSYKFKISREVNPFLKSVSKYNKICTGNLRKNLYQHYKFKYNIVRIPQISLNNFSKNIPIELHDMTIRCMEKNYDIIVNPLLIDTKNTSYINVFAFVKGHVLCKETNIDGINKNAYYPYIFKKKRLKINSKDFNQLSNCASMRELKCSAVFQYQNLKKYQKENIDRVFILGFGYEIKNKKYDFNLNNELFKNKIHFIKIENEEELSQKCKNAFSWLNLCKTEGDKWDIYNLNTVPEKWKHYLLPNTCNKNSWSNIKKDLSEKMDDVGLFWNIGSSHRRDLHAKKIYSWKDPKFLNYIDQKFNKNANMMKHMVSISKNPNSPSIFLPNKKIKNLVNNWNISNRLEFYIDFETINTSVSNKEIIYLIGMSVKLPNGEKEYYSYMIRELTLEEEASIIQEWVKDMNKLEKKYAHNYIPNLFCWGNAEIQMIESLMYRHRYKPLKIDINFIDMCKMFRSEPILIKGAKEGFSLKHILKNMVNNKLIEEIKYEDFCNRGDISIVHALEYYKTKNNKIQKDLIEYNRIDCVALMKIVDKVREFC